jgi:hypothetical protein
VTLTAASSFEQFEIVQRAASKHSAELKSSRFLATAAFEAQMSSRGREQMSIEEIGSRQLCECQRTKSGSESLKF